MGASKRVGALPVSPVKPGVSAPVGAKSTGLPGSGANQRSCLTSQLRKTKICMYHLKGACQYGSECAFAHSCAELESIPDLRKTRLCQAFDSGSCNNPDCSFAHGEEELRSTNLFYKKTLCIWNQKGKCRNGDQCRFAHGTSELRFAPGGIVPGTEGEDGTAAVEASLRAGGQSGEVPAKGKSAAIKLNEPMKVQPAACLAESQVQTALGTAAAPLCQWPPGFAPSLAAIAGGTGDLRVDLEQIRTNIINEQLKADLERLRENVFALTQKCNQIQWQVKAADSGHIGMIRNHLTGSEISAAGVGMPPTLLPGSQWSAFWGS